MKRIILGLSLALLTAHAHAVCQQSNLKGRWNAMIVPVDVPTAFNCEINFDKGGNITSGQCQYPNFSIETVTAGSGRLSSECRANIEVIMSNGLRIEILANVNRSKDTALGAWTSNQQEWWGTFSAVKY